MDAGRPWYGNDQVRGLSDAGQLDLVIGPSQHLGRAGGLSDVRTTMLLYRAAILPITGRLPRSRSPPHPKMVMIFSAPSCLKRCWNGPILNCSSSGARIRLNQLP